MNPGDLSWEPLKALGSCEIYERSTSGEAVERLAGAAVALTNKVPIDRVVLEKCPELRLIAVTATGHNIIDGMGARERGVTVSNVPNYSTPSVAQAVFALLLELTNRTGHHGQTVRDGRWSRSADFCYWDYPLVELAGLNMGIIGFGRIGRQVARIAQAFGMNVLVYHHRPVTELAGADQVSLEALLARSDVVSLHCPLTDETKGMINAERLHLMKKTAFLINTSRGPLIMEEDLARALQSEEIAGAGLDVLGIEPPAANHPLFKAPNCFITPHLAWGTRAARQRLMDATVENVSSFLKGTPRNVVNRG